jgi:hypothetical protein
METPSVRLATLVCAVILIATAIPAPVRAQGAAREKTPPAKPAPPNDPRRGPRLEYTQGPAACLTEQGFRDEVAIILDGVDHLDQTSADKLSVKFERLKVEYYRGTLVYTDAAGKSRPPTIKMYNNCEILGRWVAGTASGFVPEAPKPPPEPTPLPQLPACEVRPACGDSRLPPSAAWAPLPAAPPGFQKFEVVARPPTFLEWLRKMDVTIALSTVALVGVGVTESVAPGFGLAADIRGKMFSLALEVRGTVPGTVYARVPIDPSKHYSEAKIDVSEWTGLLVPCVRYSYFVGCAVVQGGVLSGTNPYTDLPLGMLSLGPRAGFEVPLGERFAVFGFGELLARVIQPVFDFVIGAEGTSPPNTRWVSSPVTGFFAAGLLVKLN